MTTNINHIARTVSLLPQQMLEPLKGLVGRTHPNAPIARQIHLLSPALQSHLRGGRFLSLQALNISAEAVHVLGRVSMSDPPRYTNWTICRSVLEGCGLVAWLCDPRLDAATRTSRILAVELKDKSDFGRFMTLSPKSERTEVWARSDGANRRDIQRLETARAALGSLPKADLTAYAKALGAEEDYSRMSAAAHGSSWAVGSIRANWQRYPASSEKECIYLLLSAGLWFMSAAKAFVELYSSPAFAQSVVPDLIAQYGRLAELVPDPDEPS
ncbi:MAG: hypothetical protein O2822_05100 [Chloroflexi bacterium]|nr:hypothetical protein [Chloroflexota bacterium]